MLFSDMTVQVMLSTESISTDITHEWFFSSVSEHMIVQVSLSTAPISTDITHEWFFSSVSVQVFLLTASISTDIKNKWFLSIVSVFNFNLLQGQTMRCLVQQNSRTARSEHRHIPYRNKKTCIWNFFRHYKKIIFKFDRSCLTESSITQISNIKHTIGFVA